MLATPLLVLAFAATGFAQATPPAGYRKVYMTSNVNTKFVVVPKTPVKAGSTLVVQTLTSKPDQQWWLQNGKTRIQLVDTTLCMDAGAKSAWKDMAPIALAECSETADGQKWEVKTDGRIAVDLSPSPRKLCLGVWPAHRLILQQNSASISSTCEPQPTTLLVSIHAPVWATRARRTRVSTGRLLTLLVKGSEQALPSKRLASMTRSLSAMQIHHHHRRGIVS